MTAAVSDVTEQTYTPGLVVRKNRRVGVVLEVGEHDLAVLASKGVEQWKPDDVRVGDQKSSTAALYVVRALDAAKTAETAATTGIEALKRTDRVQRALIQRVAHNQGERNGIQSGLDDLLEKYGLERRPTKFTVVTVCHVRYTYVGGQGLRDTGAPLSMDQYATFGRVPPRAVIDRVRLVQLEAQDIGLKRIAECTCDSTEDGAYVPDPTAIAAAEGRQFRLVAGWTREILATRMGYVVEARTGNGCRHHGALVNGPQTWGHAMPDAAPIPGLTLPSEPPAQVTDFRNGDTVVVMVAGDGLRIGQTFTIADVDYREDRFSTRDGYAVRKEWAERTNVRLGDTVWVETAHWGMDVGHRVIVDDIEHSYDGHLAYRGRSLDGAGGRYRLRRDRVSLKPVAERLVF